MSRQSFVFIYLMIITIHVIKTYLFLFFNYEYIDLFKCLILPIYIIFFGFFCFFYRFLFFCLVQQMMLVLESLGSWLPFTIISLVCFEIFRVCFIFILSCRNWLVCCTLFNNIYSTLSTKSKSRLFSYISLFNFIDYCFDYSNFIANRRYSCIIYEIS